MSKKLLICEKPSQARDIARVLGAKNKQEFCLENDNYIVTWCLGHLLETAKPDHYRDDLKPWRIEKLPIIPEKWSMQPVNKVKKQLNAIKKLIKSSTHIIIATDADREGEVIAREIIGICNYKGTIERLWLSALDDISIKKAFKSIRKGKETESLYHAGLGRQRADWIIGMNMTMATTVLFGRYGEGVLSVGRVQTPTLKLIVDRDRIIENFKPQDYYELYAQFADNNKQETQQSVWLKWSPPKSMQNDEQGHCFDKNGIIEVAKKIHNQNAEIKKLSKSKKKQPPPIPFTLSTLQKKASALFGFTAKRTLNTAQELYEKHKATTYPRSDSGYLPLSQHQDAEQILSALIKIDSSVTEIINKCNTSLKSPAWNDKKVGAHHGIIPTANNKVKISNMSDDCRKIYNLIRNVYIAQFLGDYIYEYTALNVECQNEIFQANGKTPLIAGWKVILSKESWGEDKKQENETKQEIPNWNVKTILTEQTEKIADKKTKPPAHFSEGAIISAMESVANYIDNKELKKILRETSGIGTQATRAAIIDTLISREYIHRKQKKLLSTEKGRALIDILPDCVTNPATTAMWEQQLEDVSNGKLDLNSFLSSQKQSLLTMLASLKSSDIKATPLTKTKTDKKKYSCPSCQKPLRRIKPKGKKRYFWGCSGYPDCNITLPDFNGKPGKNKSPGKSTDKKCDKCNNGYLIERKGKYGNFFGCSNYPKCDNIVKIKTT